MNLQIEKINMYIDEVGPAFHEIMRMKDMKIKKITNDI